MYRSLTTTPRLPRPDALAVALYDKTKRLLDDYAVVDRQSGRASGAAA